MSKQVKFWESVRDFARVTRCGRNVDLKAAADALEVEQLAEQRLRSLQQTVPMAAGFARRDPAITTESNG